MVNSSPREDFPSRPTVLFAIVRLQIGILLLRVQETLRRTGFSSESFSALRIADRHK